MPLKCCASTKINFFLKLYLTLRLKYSIIKSQQNTTNPKQRKVGNPMLNKFLVAGRMTADPEIKTAGESRYCKFSIACERPKRKSKEKSDVDFFDCIAWNRNADVVVDWFGKGDMITLVGAVHINRYEKDGQKRTSTEVRVEEIHFSGGKKNNNAPNNSEYGNPYIGTENDPLF